LRGGEHLEQSHFAELVLFQKKLAEIDLESTKNLFENSIDEYSKGYFSGMVQSINHEIERLNKLHEICSKNEKNAGQGVLN
jgi:hypothetical protein